MLLPQLERTRARSRHTVDYGSALTPYVAMVSYTEHWRDHKQAHMKYSTAHWPSTGSNAAPDRPREQPTANAQHHSQNGSKGLPEPGTGGVEGDRSTRGMLLQQSAPARADMTESWTQDGNLSAEEQ